MQNTKAHALKTLCNTNIVDIEQNLVHGGFKTKNVFCCAFLFALGLQPRQRLTKVQANSEAQESHFMISGVQESVRE